MPELLDTPLFARLEAGSGGETPVILLRELGRGEGGNFSICLEMPSLPPKNGVCDG